MEEPYYDESGNLRWVSSNKKPIYDKMGHKVGDMVFQVAAERLRESFADKAMYW